MGAGGNGAKLLAGAVPLVPNIQLVAACDVNAEMAEKRSSEWNCKRFTSVDEMLDTMGQMIDVIHVATPSGLHLPVIKAVLQRGKHVLSEKPLETTLDKMREALEAARASQGRLFVVSQTRWVKAAQLAAKAFASGRLGTFVKATVVSPWKRGNEYYRSWRGKWEADGGAALINQTIHAVDVSTWLVSILLGCNRHDMITSIDGVISRVAHSAEVLEAEDYAHMRLRAGGGIITVTAMTCADPEGPVTYEFVGRDGRVKFDSTGRIHDWELGGSGEDEEVARLRQPVSAGIGAASDPLAAGSEAHAEMLKALTAAIENGTPFELEAADGAFAGAIIRRFYGCADDPMGLRPNGFRA